MWLLRCLGSYGPGLYFRKIYKSVPHHLSSARRETSVLQGAVCTKRSAKSGAAISAPDRLDDTLQAPRSIGTFIAHDRRCRGVEFTLETDTRSNADT